MRADQIQTVAAINSGSSTLKFGLFSCEEPLEEIVKGKITGIGSAECRLSIQHAGGQHDIAQPGSLDSSKVAAELLSRWLRQRAGLYRLNGIAHRIVHGGPRYREPQLIDEALLMDLEKLVPLAPLHMPDALAIVNVFLREFPAISQVACFDTSFHAQLPFEARHYPIPRHFWEKGILRYGFHGISCEYILQQLQKNGERIDSKKIIIAHLGSGASMTAVRNGISVDTSMGFTPAGGMMMNTRAGDIDPGVIMYLLKEEKLEPAELDELFNKRSGLAAVAGSDHNIQQLLDRGHSDEAAAQAVQLYCYYAKKQLGALVAALGGLDILVFTGGIGEHSPVIRQRICANMQYLGIELNDVFNDGGEELISELPSRVRVYVIPANEEIVLARHANEFIRQYH